MKVKTSELSGTALDWAVAKCEGHPNLFDMDDVYGIKVYRPFEEFAYFEPSANWAQGGPIIEREKINVGPDFVSGWSANHRIKGPTPLIAAMRCYVASKLGDEVEIPKEMTNENL
jgi:hypothetical protein